MSIDQAKVAAFADQVVGDIAAAMSGVMTNLGHKLGLYRAMAGSGPLTSVELAQRTGLHERYVREWLNNQMAGGYLDYDSAAGAYTLSDEHALVLANPDSPAFLAGGFDMISSMWIDEEKIAQAFRTGNGIGWHEHHPHLFCGMEAIFRTGYRTDLAQRWIPALDGVAAKLENGGKVADIGCGHGASTIIMAKAFPQSSFVGFDYHPQSIEVARLRAEEAGVANRTTFEVASAKEFAGDGYDLICFMDCLHDLGDPLGAARHALSTLTDDGTVLLVEPFAGDRVEDNIGPVGRMFYAASTAVCVPNSLSQETGLGLGAQAGEAQLSAVLSAAGFSRVRRVAETPFNIVIEARP
ncbi:Methyltransferase domain-containing protein [Modicisalibacter muralis]|uniref:Methyltransferase domain-containing protein n=1 Tax=Modicisalibacter muralis TaxID=119000 RepID=A0A1G9F3W9_9GAMM|nr:class I SAM-dependent methyltransferase [Halomonas muralis]SDK83057.1 Methyltransferase domain-containing protein [Halomonas muralis]